MIEFISAMAMFVIFILIRNYWVYRSNSLDLSKFHDSLRMRVMQGEIDLDVNQEWDEYEKSLPSYNTMVLKFWVWDFEKFRK